MCRVLDYISTNDVEGIVISVEPLYVINTVGEICYIDTEEYLSILNKENKIYDSLLILANYFFEMDNLENEEKILAIKKKHLKAKIKEELTILNFKSQL